MKVIQQISEKENITVVGMYKGHTRNVKGIGNQLLRNKKPTAHSFTNVIRALNLNGKLINEKEKLMAKPSSNTRLRPRRTEKKVTVKRK